jgi:uncharacterized protein YndB with AHSA1/START domain
VIDEKALAQFVDRHTMVYERVYPHEIALVFEAVSTAEHLDVWLLPESRVERRLGGSYAFGWGGSCDVPEATRGTLTVYDPPTAIQYTTPEGSFMRFDLDAEGDTTRMRFTLHYLPNVDNKVEEYPGGDLPAGLDTAWRPGFLAGFHEMVDRLDGFLRDEWTAEDLQADLQRHMEGSGHDDELIAAYRAYVASSCPEA